MKILLTGVAGFIGSHIAEKLLKENHTTIGVDNLNDYYNPAFKKYNLSHFQDHKNCTFIKTDITDSTAMEKIFAEHNFDQLIHLAAAAGVRYSVENPLLYQKVNCYGSHLLFDLCAKYHVKNVIFASSSSVYGNNKKIPFSESDPVDHPISAYAATKKAVEVMAHVYHHLYEINMIGLRFFTVYGERGRPDMTPYMFTEKILHENQIELFGNTDEIKRDFTYIDDIVDGIYRCIDKKFGYEIINLGNNTPVSLREYIETFEKVIGKKAIIKNVPQPKADVKITYADISKASDLLGWEPKTKLEDGLEKLVKWYKKVRL